MEQSRGPFIVVEGLDGSGVSSQARLLQERLLRDKWEVYLTKEPSDGPAGAIIRLALARRLVGKGTGPVSRSSEAQALALLFAADRVDHLANDIVPWLERGVTVICDRYYLSSFAYQGVDAGDVDWLRSINAKCLKPDITLFLDVNPQICYKRMQRARWHIELFEEPAKLEQVRASYLKAIKYLLERGEDIVTVDGNQPINLVHKEVFRSVKKYLARQRPELEGQLRLEPTEADG